jgi:hypothetical protein
MCQTSDDIKHPYNDSMFSVGTHPSFQILDYYNGGTKKKSEMSSGLIKLK